MVELLTLGGNPAFNEYRMLKRPNKPASYHQSGRLILARIRTHGKRGAHALSEMGRLTQRTCAQPRSVRPGTRTASSQSAIRSSQRTHSTPAGAGPYMRAHQPIRSRGERSGGAEVAVRHGVAGLTTCVL